MGGWADKEEGARAVYVTVKGGAKMRMRMWWVVFAVLWLLAVGLVGCGRRMCRTE